MHVCQINMPIEYYSPVSGGAVATVIMEQTRELIARGHRVTVLTPVSDDGCYGIGEVIPLKVHSRENLSFLQRRLSGLMVRMRRWDWPYFDHYLRQMLAALKELSPQPDVVIIHNDLVSPRYIKRILPGVRIFSWLHNECRTNQRDIRKTVSCVEKFVGVSGYVRDWAREYYHLSADKVVAMLNGVNLEIFTPNDSECADGGALSVLYVGRIDRNKGADIAVDAVKILQEEGLPVRFVCAGAIWWYGNGDQASDPYFRSLKAKMNAVSADFLGHVRRSEMPALYRRHDVVCVLSRSHDPCPLVLLEAMASGCAVMGSDRGGIPEVCNGAALIVDPDDLQSVVSALRGLATDRPALARQKIKSLECAAKSPWAVRVDRLERLMGAGPLPEKREALQRA